MRTKRRLLLTAVLALFGGTLVGAPAEAAQHETRLTTVLSWKNEVDTGTDHGFGFASVRVSADRACFGVRWRNIPEPMAAHIHAAPQGANGDVVVPLFLEGPGPNSSAMSAWGCVEVDPMLAEAIAMHPENYYVNLHTEEFPSGAIRGQLAHPMM
jgi:hypothetical protein